MASITDLFGKSSIDTDHSLATTVKTIRTVGATVIEAFDLSKFADDTAVFFATYKKTTAPVTGEVLITNFTSCKALVNVGANTLTNLVIAPGYTDLGNEVGDFIECLPTSYWENSLIDGITAQHNQDGTHKSVTTNTLSVSTSLTLPASSIPTAAIADGAVTGAKIDFASTGAGAVWWEELGRTTLGSAGDTISVTPIAVRKYLKVRWYATATGGTIGGGDVRFNNDSGNNYTRRSSLNNGADSVLGSQAQSGPGLSPAALPVSGEIDIINVSAQEKMFHGFAKNTGASGAVTSNNLAVWSGKWANTADAITRVDIINNGGTGDYAIGSEVVVLGHN